MRPIIYALGIAGLTTPLLTVSLFSVDSTSRPAMTASRPATSFAVPVTTSRVRSADSINWSNLTEENNKRVKLVVEVKGNDGAFYAGQPIRISLCLENIAKEKITLFRPSDPVLYQAAIEVIKHVGDASSQVIPGHGSETIRYENKSMQEDFIDLEPGGKTPSVHLELIPLVTGEAAIFVEYFSRRATIQQEQVDKDGKGVKTIRQTFPNVIIGGITGLSSITVREKPSTEMRERFDAARAIILGKEGKAEDRIALLSRIADEKHVFAAEFVVSIWRDSKVPEIKAAALANWSKLFRFGTAYRSVPEVLDLLTNPDTPQDIRAEFLGTLCTCKFGVTDGHEYVLLEVGRQAYYSFTADERKKLSEVATILAEGKELKLAAEAKALLARISEGRKVVK